MMRNVLFRPELVSDCEMCDICGRGVGMVIDEREIKNPHPFMCFICEERFPAEQWEKDEQGLYFNLSKNGYMWAEDHRIKVSLKKVERKQDEKMAAEGAK